MIRLLDALLSLRRRAQSRDDTAETATEALVSTETPA